ncbi:hotdog fold domain-containing protein [Luteimonas sp. MJ293]|uniref:hotdog fold domain-containing protein n=1 Tax=Luteimonas sp. MJ146 TaxID=3129240 RepID=UPI0031BA0DD8
MQTQTSRLANTYARMSRLPFGRWLFGRVVCWRAPYFATITPRFLVVEPDRCEVAIRDRRRVHNHIGTVHAIALCNLAELAGGVMMEAGTPRGMRWIPKGMTVEYLKKAVGTLRAVATPVVPIEVHDEGYEVPVDVEIRDPQETAVFRATIAMWVSPRARRD